MKVYAMFRIAEVPWTKVVPCGNEMKGEVSRGSVRRGEVCSTYLGSPNGPRQRCFNIIDVSIGSSLDAVTYHDNEETGKVGGEADVR